MSRTAAKECMEMINFLSRMTDELIYLCDLKEKKIYFSENCVNKFPMPWVDASGYSLQQMQQFMRSKNGKKPFFNIEAFQNLPEDVIHQEYHFADEIGTECRIYSAEKMQYDSEGNPKWIIGYVSDIRFQLEHEKIHGSQEEVLTAALKKSIENDYEGFAICYCPRITLDSCEIQGVEAKICYYTEAEGRILPERFMPILEQTGMIAEMDRWLLHGALVQLKEWRRHLPKLHMSMNLSLLHMKEKTIWDQIFEELEDLDLPGNALTLELSENVCMRDYKSFQRIFERLRRKGIRIAIDDFKTGYSSLRYLSNLDVDEIEISPNIVSGIQYSAYNYRLLGNLVELAHGIKVSVCCKGAETEVALRSLKELQADFSQGPLFGKTMSKKAFEEAYIQKDSAAYEEYRANEARYRAIQIREQSLEQDYVRYEKMAAVLDGMDEVIYVSDPENQDLLYLNASGRKLTECYDYHGKKCYEVMFGKPSPCEFCQRNHVGRDAYHVWELDSDYLHRHFLVKNKLIQWTGKPANLTVGIDITEKEIMSKAAASKDPLTGVYNRKVFEEKVTEHMTKPGGTKDSMMILLDVDNFKAINDRYGHMAGDQVLKQMVEALRKVFRKQDLVGRLGGDEFLVFLKDFTDKEIISGRITEFQKILKENNQYQATCSLGATLVKRENFSYSDSLQKADVALYKSKENGKDMFCFAEQEIRKDNFK